MTARELPPGTQGFDDVVADDYLLTGFAAVTVEAIDTFAELSGDRFAIHMLETEVARHGFPGRVTSRPRRSVLRSKTSQPAPGTSDSTIASPTPSRMTLKYPGRPTQDPTPLSRTAAAVFWSGNSRLIQVKPSPRKSIRRSPGPTVRSYVDPLNREIIVPSPVRNGGMPTVPSQSANPRRLQTHPMDCRFGV